MELGERQADREDWRDGESGVWTIALSPDGKKVVSGSSGDGVVRLWDIDTGKIIAKWTGDTLGVSSVCWSRDGRQVLSGSTDGTARQWNVESGETILGPIETGHKHVYAAVYSPDMTLIATGGYHKDEHLIKIWDTQTGKLVATLKGHMGAVLCLAWTSDGKTLISGSYDDSIRTWNTRTWKQIAVLDKHTSTVYAIAISPNDRILASASSDNTARLWNLDNGQPISLPLQHADELNCVSFSADGTLLAAGCEDTNAYTWDVSVIVRKAGLDDLLKEGNKPLLNDDAIRRPVQQRQDPRRVPPGFFDEPPHSANFSPRRHNIAAPHVRTLLSRIASLFSHTHSDGNNPLSRPRPLDGPRNILSETPRRPNGAGIELHERRPAVVDVPYTQGKRRNASAREKRKPAGSSRPPKPSVTQHSVRAASAQSSSQLHSMPSAIPAPASTPATTTSSFSRLHVTIRHAGRWTRFWLFICCCNSLEYTEGRH